MVIEKSSDSYVPMETARREEALASFWDVCSCSFKDVERSTEHKTGNKDPAACRRIGVSLCVSKINKFKNNHLKRNSPLMSLVRKCAPIVLTLEWDSKKQITFQLPAFHCWQLTVLADLTSGAEKWVVCIFILIKMEERGWLRYHSGNGISDGRSL